MSAEIFLESQQLAPGSVLRGRVELFPLPGHASRRVELAVLWETSGKGDTDIGVILYRRLADGDEQAANAAHPFEVTLPFVPLSYAGRLLKIGWCVRVRRLNTFGDDEVFDAPFELGWPT